MGLPAVLLFTGLLCPTSRAEVPVPLLNPGFDSTVTVGGKLVPAVWRMSVGDTNSYDFACDTDNPQSGAGALRVRVKVAAPRAAAISTSGSLTRSWVTGCA